MDERVSPIADVNPIWERDCSVYPDVIRIAMTDGQVVSYRLDVQQPHPSFTALMETLDKLPVYGGEHVPGYKAKHEEQKKPNLWLRIQRLSEKKR